MIWDVILSTAILFSPLFLLLLVTGIVETFPKAERLFDRFDRKLFGRIDRFFENQDKE